MDNVFFFFILVFRGIGWVIFLFCLGVYEIVWVVLFGYKINWLFFVVLVFWWIGVNGMRLIDFIFVLIFRKCYKMLIECIGLKGGEGL